MRLAILGFGREGKSLLKFLKQSLKFKKSSVAILDKKYGGDYLKNLSDFDIVFRSPGVPYNLPEIQSALRHGTRFSSITKLFFDYCPARIIGITGSKGKSTTSTLIYKILKNSGFDVHFAGNIGKPALDILPKLSKKSIVVLELSSFQLQDLEKSPPVAVVVDIFPEHLDIHKNVKEYLDAKANIVSHQKKSDAVFYFKDNSGSGKIAQKSPGKKIGVVGKPFGVRKNLEMAAAVAAYLGCPAEKISATIKKFKGLEHRIEFVRAIKGVSFYNDSASTNPHAAAAAIVSFPKNQPLILIAGGKDKNLDYAPLARAASKSKNLKLVVLFGENKEKIKKALNNIKIKIAKDLKSAVKTAFKIFNRQSLNYPIAVIFSPASASFDMFKDYKDRGKRFKEIVRSLSFRP